MISRPNQLESEFISETELPGIFAYLNLNNVPKEHTLTHLTKNKLFRRAYIEVFKQNPETLSQLSQLTPSHDDQNRNILIRHSITFAYFDRIMNLTDTHRKIVLKNLARLETSVLLTPENIELVFNDSKEITISYGALIENNIITDEIFKLLMQSVNPDDFQAAVFYLYHCDNDEKIESSNRRTLFIPLLCSKYLKLLAAHPFPGMLAKALVRLRKENLIIEENVNLVNGSINPEELAQVIEYKIDHSAIKQDRLLCAPFPMQYVEAVNYLNKHEILKRAILKCDSNFDEVIFKRDDGVILILLLEKMFESNSLQPYGYNQRLFARFYEDNIYQKCLALDRQSIFDMNSFLKIVKEQNIKIKDISGLFKLKNLRQLVYVLRELIENNFSINDWLTNCLDPTSGDNLIYKYSNFLIELEYKNIKPKSVPNLLNVDWFNLAYDIFKRLENTKLLKNSDNLLAVINHSDIHQLHEMIMSVAKDNLSQEAFDQLLQSTLDKGRIKPPMM